MLRNPKPTGTAVRLSSLLLIAMIVSTAISTGLPGPRPASAYASAAPEDPYPVEIMPQMELLAGVLAQTSWIKDRGPSGEGSEYYRGLKAFMQPYADHEAVKIAQQLTSHGFSYDAPPCFACHLGPLPDLEPVADYPEYLVGRAKGRDILERFRVALKDLARISDFQGFLTKWDGTLRGCVENSSKGFDRLKVENWLTGFFGWQPEEFHVVLTPAMFPGGGYGATVMMKDGRSVGYEITRSEGKSAGAPDLRGGQALESLTLHELGHYFVNPSLGAHPAELSNLAPLFRPVASQMRSMAYPSVEVFLSEQVLRASTAVAQGDLYGEAAYERGIASNEQYGFYLTRLIAEELKTYASSRDKYPKFTDFVPDLLKRLQAETSNATVSPGAGAAGGATAWVLANPGAAVAFAAIILGALILLTRRFLASRKKTEPPETD